MLRLRQSVEWGIYGGIILLPLQTRYILAARLNGGYWEYGSRSLYGTEILWWLLIGLFFVWLYRQPRPTVSLAGTVRRAWADPAGRIYLGVIALAICSGLSIFWSLDSNLALYGWFRLVEALAIMAVIVVGPIQITRLVAALAASAALQSILGTWQFFTQYIPANKWLGLALHTPTLGGSIVLQSETERWLRAYGLFPHPNLLGGFLALGLLVSIWLGAHAKTMWSRRAWLLTSVSIVPGLFFSFSRSAWVGVMLGIGLLVWWLLRRGDAGQRRQGLILVALTIGCATILSLVYGHLLWTRLASTQPLEVNSIDLRLTFTQQAWQIIRETVPWGTGIGNYTVGVHRLISGTWPSWYYQPVHNIALLILAELGIIGLLLCVWLGWQLLRRGLAKSDNDERYLFVMLFAVLLVVGLFDHYWWTLYSGIIMFWLVVAGLLRSLRA
jgi:O-antigen ligase